MTGNRPTLRIGIVAPVAAAVTGQSQSSIEQLVWLLCEGLVRRGHEVTLFASGDSDTSARLHAIYPRGYTDDERLWTWTFHEAMHVAEAYRHASDFDIIHSHNYYFALPFSSLVRTPTLHTYHILPDQDIARAFAAAPHTAVTATSQFQQRIFALPDPPPVIYHGIDPGRFPYSSHGDGYLLYLGRFLPEKGPLAAIQAARSVDLPLVLAGPRNEYYRECIAPLVDGSAIRYAGAVGAEERAGLLGRAGALLYPIQGPEPFGLVMIEAMMCGTPVLAFDRGAVPEVVTDGVTGYVTSDLAGMVGRVPAALALDRLTVHEEALRRFNAERMVHDYGVVYERIAAGSVQYV